MKRFPGKKRAAFSLGNCVKTNSWSSLPVSCETVELLLSRLEHGPIVIGLRHLYQFGKPEAARFGIGDGLFR